MAAYPLTRPASWRLTLGAPEMPLIRWAGGALWASAALTAIVWLGALVVDARDGHLRAAWLLLAVPAIVAWLVLALRIWRRWSRQRQVLTLAWRGPVQVDRDTGVAHGGFHVGEWGAPARVRIVLSFQGWLLLSLSRVPAKSGAPAITAHVWLDACDESISDITEPGHAERAVRNRSLHQLRTLLHLPPAMTTQEGDANVHGAAPATGMAPSMASWPHISHPGTTLLSRLASLLRTDARPGAATSGKLDTVFPATTVMAESPVARQPMRVRGGGQG